MPRRDFSKVPFAATGDTNAIPTPVQPDGSISLQTGWGFDYQRDNGAGGGTPDPLAKSIDREDMNGILNEITASIGEIQQNGYPLYAASAAPYPINAVVRYTDNQNWRSTVTNNNTLPGAGPEWVLAASQPAASETVAGIIRISTNAEALAKTNDLTAMTPLKTAQQIAASASRNGVKSSFSNLVISSTGTSSTFNINADEVSLENSAGEYFTARNVALTPTQGASIDTGTVAAGTWYSIWLIAKPDGTVSALTSLSATNPLMPSGYTFKARIGWFRTDGTANRYPFNFVQRGKRCTIANMAGGNTGPFAIVTGATGNPGTGSYTAVPLGNFIPPTASTISVFAWAYTAGAGFGVANANGFGGTTGTSPPPIAQQFSTTAGSVDFTKQSFDFVLISQNLYVAATTADFVLRCMGWEDNL